MTKEMAGDKSICRSCFHSYVCEQFNEHRDDHNQKCHFSNDHYVPAADVAPVVHGRWEQCFEDWRKQIEGDECSACGFQIYGGVSHFRYCPNCGAKMDATDINVGDKEEA